MSTFLVLLLLLACPLMMWLMMRGGHGHDGHAGHGQDGGGGSTSIEDLRRRRDELDEAIAARERSHDDIGRAPVTER